MRKCPRGRPAAVAAPKPRSEPGRWRDQSADRATVHIPRIGPNNEPTVAGDAMRAIDGIEELKILEGQEVGRSDWLEVSQAMVDGFAELTGDDQWIHVDVDRARRESPYGGTIAHGYLVLSLIPVLCRDIYGLSGLTRRINYGLDKVRFPSAVPCGARVRAALRFGAMAPTGDGGLRYVSHVTIEVEGGERPACVADTVVLVHP